MSHFQIKRGATGPSLLVQLFGAGDVPVNLTGATIVMRMKPRDGGPLVIDNAPATIFGDPLDGWVDYQWQPGDTDTVGEFDVEWDVTFAGGAKQTFPIDGYTEVDIDANLVSDPASTLPPLPDACWPVNEAACSELDEYPTGTRLRAIALAGHAMRMLTVGQVGGCPVTVRPCSVACASGYGSYSAGIFTPHIAVSGQWVNGCGCASNCHHLGSKQINLPGHVGRIDSVKVDGVVVPPSAYRVDGGNALVRTDGEPWPVVQDMSLPDTEPGTFSVTYLPAYEVDGLGAWAAGVLACEFAKALSADKKCRLPSTVQTITRQGVSMTLAPGVFAGGVTGIMEVDVYIKAVNPHGLKSAPAVWSPDRRGFRRTT